MQKETTGWIKYAPMMTWTVVYVLTCVVGALLIILDYRPFVLMFRYFSGVDLDIPEDGATLAVLYTLLLVAPLLVWGGYSIGWRLSETSGIQESRWKIKSSHSWLWAVSTFCVCMVVAIWSLVHGGACGDLRAWLQYDVWVKARWRLFDSLGFFEFVNIYLFLPLSAGWMFMAADTGGGIRKIVAWIAVMAAVVSAVILFQKKSVIVTLILLMVIFGLWRLKSGYKFKHPRLIIGIGSIVLAAVYFLLLVLPVCRQAEHQQTQVEQLEAQAQQLEAQAQQLEAHEGQLKVKAEQLKAQAEQLKAQAKQLVALSKEFGGFNNFREALFFYALLAPLTRTSAPAIYYSFVFPHEHPYYGLDLGQDILGFGTMPDDNKVVWQRMNPNIDGGTVSAPFHFVLYSQVGLWGALIGSFIAGLALGGSWFFVLVKIKQPATSVLAGSLVMLLSVYLAIDSARNSLLVSYGVAWGGLFLCWVWASENFGKVLLNQRFDRSSVQLRTDET